MNKSLIILIGADSGHKEHYLKIIPCTHLIYFIPNRFIILVANNG